MIVTVQHLRASKLCMRGARAWFRARGLDWAAFVRDGMPVDQVARIDDAFAQRVLALAQRQEGGRG